jgi:hypothetical protein
MVCVVVPLVLKRNIGVFLESSEVLAVKLFSLLLWFCIAMMSSCFRYAVF